VEETNVVHGAISAAGVTWDMVSEILLIRTCKDPLSGEKYYSHQLKHQMLKTNVMFRSGVEMKVQLGRGVVV
jgi:hypothetical protein